MLSVVIIEFSHVTIELILITLVTLVFFACNLHQRLSSLLMIVCCSIIKLSFKGSNLFLKFSILRNVVLDDLVFLLVTNCNIDVVQSWPILLIEISNLNSLRLIRINLFGSLCGCAYTASHFQLSWTHTSGHCLGLG